MMKSNLKYLMSNSGLFLCLINDDILLRKHVKSILIVIILLISNLSKSQSNAFIADALDFGNKTYKIDKRLYKDNFKSLDNWIIEQQAEGSFNIASKCLDITDKGGTTVWFKEKLSSPILIEYEVVILDDDRISDMNCFWMSTDPEIINKSKTNKAHSLGKRNGIFKEYDNLRQYYVGCGVHNNTKSRFRRYDGKGNKPLLPEHDLTDQKYLLQVNKTYKIQLVAFKNRVQYFRNGICFYDVIDKDPLNFGWFGFRIYKSHQIFKRFKVYSLKKN